MSETRRGGVDILRLLVDAPPGAPPAGQIVAYTDKVGPETKFFTISPEGFVRTFGAIPSISYTAGETVSVGELSSLIDSAGSTRLVKAASTGAGNRQTAAGIVTVGAVAGAVAQIAAFGQASIPDAEWDAVPGSASIGDPVFMSLTPGNVSLSPPASGTIQRVGIVALIGGGSTTILVQVGQPIR